MNATIEFVESVNETTLLIDGGQAMQGWEADLMRRCGDILCRHGSEFMEVGLGLGLSALHIGSRPTTRRHTVIELHQPVIDHFLTRNPTLPAALKSPMATSSPCCQRCRERASMAFSSTPICRPRRATIQPSGTQWSRL